MANAATSLAPRWMGASYLIARSASAEKNRGAWCAASVQVTPGKGVRRGLSGAGVSKQMLLSFAQLVQRCGILQVDAV